MIVEVHGMGFWTRVRFPPGPYLKTAESSGNEGSSSFLLPCIRKELPVADSVGFELRRRANRILKDAGLR